MGLLEEEEKIAPNELFRADGFDWKNILEEGFRFCDPYRQGSSSSSHKARDLSTVASEEDDEDDGDTPVSTPTKSPLKRSPDVRVNILNFFETISKHTQDSESSTVMSTTSGAACTGSSKPSKTPLIQGFVPDASSSLPLRVPDGGVVITSVPTPEKECSDQTDKFNKEGKKSLKNKPKALPILLVLLVALWGTAFHHDFQFKKFQEGWIQNQHFVIQAARCESDRLVFQLQEFKDRSMSHLTAANLELPSFCDANATWSQCLVQNKQHAQNKIQDNATLLSSLTLGAASTMKESIVQYKNLLMKEWKSALENVNTSKLLSGQWSIMNAMGIGDSIVASPKMTNDTIQAKRRFGLGRLFRK